MKIMAKVTLYLASMFLTCGTLAGCGDDGSSSPTAEEAGESGESGENLETESTDDNAESTDDDGESAVDDGEPPFPPGCTDNGWTPSAAAIAADTIRLSSVTFDCDEAFELPPYPDSSADDYDAHLVIPGLAPGIYDLSEGIATLTVDLHWDYEQSSEGCFCVDSPITGATVTTGTVELTELDSGLGVQFEGLPEPFSGSLGFQVGAGEC